MEILTLRLAGCGAGERVFIPRIPLISSELIFEPRSSIGSSSRVPIKLAFAMTINKSQVSRRSRSQASTSVKNVVYRQVLG
eukprot:497534-Hanusia_phi.AAC.2